MEVQLAEDLVVEAAGAEDKMVKINILLNIVICFGILIALSSVACAGSEVYGGCGMMQGLYGGYGGGMMLLYWVTWVLVVTLIISAICWLVKSASRRR